MEFPAFVGGSAVGQSPIASVARTINFYVQQNQDPTAKSAASLYPTPGFTQRVSVAQSPGRAGLYQNGRAFAVIGTRLYEMDSVYTATDRGTVAHTDTEPATIAANGDGGSQLLITASGVGYLYNLNTNTLSAPAALASNSNMCAMLDGYFLVLDRSTSTLKASALYDGATWSALRQAQRTIAPDQWKSLLVADRSIYLLGEATSEVWTNVGSAPLPFAPDLNVIPFGIGANYSAADLGGNAVWLTKTLDGQGKVVMASGTQARVISTEALEWAIAGYSTISDAIGESFEYLGVSFYLLTFPTANKSWLFNASNGTWSEVGHWIVASNAYDCWRPAFHFFAFGKHFWVDRTVGKIWEMSHTVYTDVDSLAIRRVRRCPAPFEQNRRLFFDRFELLLETGLAVTGASAPNVELNFANDGGKNWDTSGFQSAGARSVGATGEYLTRVYWTRLGSGRQRVFEVVMTADIAWRLVSASLQVRDGTEAR